MLGYILEDIFHHWSQSLTHALFVCLEPKILEDASSWALGSPGYGKTVALAKR